MRDVIEAILREDLHVSVPAADTDLLATGLLDSLGVVDLLVHLERRAGVRIDIDRIEIDDLRTIERLAALAARHAGKPA